MRDIVSHLDRSEPAANAPSSADLPRSSLILMEALDHALDSVGRTGKEVLFAVLERQFGLRREDVSLKPGPYMAALRSALGESCRTIEDLTIVEVRDKEGVAGWNVEETAYLLWAKYNEVHPA